MEVAKALADAADNTLKAVVIDAIVDAAPIALGAKKTAVLQKAKVLAHGRAGYLAGFREFPNRVVGAEEKFKNTEPNWMGDGTQAVGGVFEGREGNKVDACHGLWICR